MKIKVYYKLKRSPRESAITYGSVEAMKNDIHNCRNLRFDYINACDAETDEVIWSGIEEILSAQ